MNDDYLSLVEQRHEYLQQHLWLYLLEQQLKLVVFQSEALLIESVDVFDNGVFHLSRSGVVCGSLRDFLVDFNLQVAAVYAQVVKEG